MDGEISLIYFFDELYFVDCEVVSNISWFFIVFLIAGLGGREFFPEEKGCSIIMFVIRTERNERT